MHPIQLIQGDCLEELPKIPAKSIAMVFGDCPYSQNRKFEWDREIDLGKLWPELMRVVADDGVIVLTGQQPYTSRVVCSNPDWFRYEWIWDKQIPKGMHRAKSQPMRLHENILVFSKFPKHNYFPVMVPREKPVTSYNMTENSSGGIGPYADNGQRFTYTEKNPTSIIRGCFEANRGTVKFHPTQKPVSLLEYLIRTYTQEGETVLDFCFGSCATGVACKNTGRKFIGIEKDVTYFELGKFRMPTD